MPRPWRDKFWDAFAGLWLAVRSERSFAVHLPMAVGVTILAAVLRVSLVEACILTLCIAMVLAAEMFNTALEYISREITREKNSGLATALNVASGAVLTASMGAAIVGSAILFYRLGIKLAWWE